MSHFFNLSIPKDILDIFYDDKKEFNLDFFFENILAIYFTANYLADDLTIHELYKLLYQQFNHLDKYQIQKWIDVLQF
jgi:hypothetical protein